MTRRTIGESWDASQGRPAGFDYLRILLAAFVILFHTTAVCHGRGGDAWLWTGPLRPVIAFVLPAFFALSGFLVAGSLFRNDLLSFATLRVVRIFPALTFEVTMSALLIGPLVTSLPLTSYFTDWHFFTYFLNTLGNIHYVLPGVFVHNPYPNNVNVQLWTVPFELQSYIVLALFAIFRLHRKPSLFLAMTVAMNVWTYVSMYHVKWKLTDPVPGQLLIVCFLYGVALYIYRDKVTISKWATIACLAAFIVLVYSMTAMYFAPIFAAYATIVIGLWNRRSPTLLGMSNYSYGVYLYGFPLQQLVVYAFPDDRYAWFNFMLSLPAALLMGFLSWHLLEEKVARRKKAILAAVQAGARYGVGTLTAALKTMSAPLVRRLSPETERALETGAGSRRG